MGKYINKNSQGQQLGAGFRNKITGLVNDGATIIDEPTEFQENLVCVVGNGRFAIVGYVYSEDEMEVFKEDDGRDRVWFVYPHASSVAQ